MKNYQFPLDGSVVIIEDKIEEALPLIKLLSHEGIATTYYTGADLELPKKPIQKIRLAFVDIQLFGPSDSHSYAQNILKKLDSIIPEDNGPYILIVWSKTEDINAETLEREVMSWTKPPVVVLRLNKTYFFTTFVDESTRDVLIERVDSSLRTRFQTDDMSAVKKAIKDSYQHSVTLKAKENALQAISKELLSKLSGVDILQLFAVWENCINKTSGKIVESFSSLHKSDEYWRDNLRSTMCRMAHTQLGKRIDSVDDNELIKNAIKTLNQIFLGVLENTTFQNDDLLKAIKIDKDIVSFSRNENGKKYEIRWLVKSGEYQLYVDEKVFPVGEKPKKKDKISHLSKRGIGDSEKALIKCFIDEYLSIEPDINTKLFLDFNVFFNECPGIIYKKSVRGTYKRRRKLLENYLKPESKIFEKNRIIGKRQIEKARLNWNNVSQTLIRNGARKKTPNSILFNLNSEQTKDLDSKALNVLKNAQEDQTYVIKDNKLKEIIFIELNVVPACDHAQKKWIKMKVRLLPGIMLPEEYSEDLKGKNDVGASLAMYNTMPLLKIDNQCYQCAFDFRLLKSEDVPKIIRKRRKPWFKIRGEVLSDILSRLSSHASRVGVTFIE